MSYCGVSEFIPIAEMVAEVKIFIPNAAPTIIESLLRKQANAFADRTKAIEVSVYEDAQAGVHGYPVTLPGCLSSLNITGVRYEGRCYSRIQDEVCQSACSSRFGFTVKNPSWIELYPAPRKDGTNDIEIAVSAGISPDACEVPAAFYKRWSQHIINGALSVLYGMKNEDWYNKGLMEMYRDWVKEGVNEVKQDVLVASTGGSGIPIEGDPWVL